ncbi:LLM class F420-dependent oxidoreductase [Amycolatopsis suaedae]|uniref:LLM class F420-dependent oxidoreductase n=1 Tax=Amycolatopsis suaedae TaxID=2510978 RepID=A0A4V2EMD1_9PSEU|nr:LLM class F420-dependent oxidoreductase [Amycolatopsis suaedae]RZQ64645.1 LLM class F420-dependent oxidoreductase [Amycolatopsis suaedae]
MKFGVLTFVTDEGIAPAALGRALEERGFDSLFLAEHSHIPTSRETPYPGGGELPRIYYRTLDPFVVLSAAATVTTRLRLGTGIALLAQRDTIHTANEVASLDFMSGGRVDFGVGVGWNREEMRNHGTDPTTRGALMDEQLQALKEIWTKDEAEFHGKHVDFDPINLWPKPAQRPHPPIYIGGGSPAALKRVVEHGDGWMPVFTPAEEIRKARTWLTEQGRPDATIIASGVEPNAEAIEANREAGVDQILFNLPTVPEAESLKHLDELASVLP